VDAKGVPSVRPLEEKQGFSCFHVIFRCAHRSSFGPGVDIYRIYETMHFGDLGSCSFEIVRIVSQSLEPFLLRLHSRRAGDIGADLRIARDRVGSSTDPTLNGHLRYPNKVDCISGRASRDYACGLKEDDVIGTVDSLTKLFGYFKAMRGFHSKLRYFDWDGQVHLAKGKTGGQQGDPAEMLIFNLTIHHLWVRVFQVPRGSGDGICC
jgi:hypothetical protein